MLINKEIINDKINRCFDLSGTCCQLLFFYTKYKRHFDNAFIVMDLFRVHWFLFMSKVLYLMADLTKYH